MVSSETESELLELFEDPGYFRFVDFGHSFMPTVIPSEDQYEVNLTEMGWEEGDHLTIVNTMGNDAIRRLPRGELRIFPSGGEVWSLSVGVSFGESIIVIGELSINEAKEVCEEIKDREPIGIVLTNGLIGASNLMYPKKDEEDFQFENFLLEKIGKEVDVRWCVEEIPEGWTMDNLKAIDV